MKESTTEINIENKIRFLFNKSLYNITYILIYRLFELIEFNILPKIFISSVLIK